MEQRTPEWYRARVGRVTASEVGAILGLSPYRDRDDVLRAMVRAYHDAPSEFTGNVATEYGVRHEAGAIVEFEMETSETVTPEGFVTYEDWLGCSPDGYTSDGRLLEVKCPYNLREDHNPLFREPDELPHYLAQMHVQMFVTGRETCWFYQWTPHGTSLKLIHRDDDWLATNISALRQFHDEYLSELGNPDHLAPKRVTINTPHAAKLIAEYDQLAEAIDLATERKQEVMQELVAIANNKSARVDGRLLTKVERAGSVSYATIVKKHLPDLDLSPFNGKPTAYWKLT